MHDTDLHIAKIAGRHHGVIARHELITSGVSEREIETRVRAGLLVPDGRGVYRHHAIPLTTKGQWLRAVHLGGPGAVLSHRSGARLNGLEEIPRAAPEISLLGGSRVKARGVIVHRTTSLDPVDVTTVDGIPTVTVARSLLGVCAVVPLHLAKTAVQVAVLQNRVTEVELACVLERLGRRGRDGTARLREILQGEIPPAELQSRLELALYGLIVESVPEPPELQYVITIDGETFIVDFAWPKRKIVVEADGRRWHSTEAAYAYALHRRAVLGSLGWLVLPFGWSDVHERCGTVRSLLTTTFAATAA